MVPVLFGRFFGFPAAFGGRTGKSTFGWAFSRLEWAVEDDNAIGAGSIPKTAGLAGLDHGSVEPAAGMATPTGIRTKS
jgi:hypothetical protein